MAIFNVEADYKAITNAVNMLGHIPNGLETALMRAYNRGAQKVRTEAVRYIAERYKVKQSEVRKQIKIFNATKSHLSAMIIFTGHRLPLSNFVADFGPKRWARNKTALVTEIIRGARKEWPGAFFAGTERGHEGTTHYGVFVRKPGTEPGKRKPQRLKRAIKEKKSLSIPEMAGYHEAVELMLEEGSEAINKELEHQIQFLLSGGK